VFLGNVFDYLRRTCHWANNTKSQIAGSTGWVCRVAPGLSAFHYCFRSPGSTPEEKVMDGYARQDLAATEDGSAGRL